MCAGCGWARPCWQRERRLRHSRSGSSRTRRRASMRARPTSRLRSADSTTSWRKSMVETSCQVRRDLSVCLAGCLSVCLSVCLSFSLYICVYLFGFNIAFKHLRSYRDGPRCLLVAVVVLWPLCCHTRMTCRRHMTWHLTPSFLCLFSVCLYVSLYLFLSSKVIYNHW